MSGVMNPFDTLFGVVISRSSSRRALMLPSFEATYPRAYMRRPASTMSARICSSWRVLMKSRLSAGPELVPALRRAEIVRRSTRRDRERTARCDVGAAHRIPGELHGARGWRRIRGGACGPDDDATNQRAQRSRDEK